MLLRVPQQDVDQVRRALARPEHQWFEEGAEGQAEAIKQVAEAEKFRERTIALGEAEAIESVFAAIHEGKPTQELIALQYLEALKKMADGKATKMFLPYEASGILSSLAGIGEIMKDGATHTSADADDAMKDGATHTSADADDAT